MFRGKKYQESAKLIDKGALYDTAEDMVRTRLKTRAALP